MLVSVQRDTWGPSEDGFRDKFLTFPELRFARFRFPLRGRERERGALFRGGEKRDIYILFGNLTEICDD